MDLIVAPQHKIEVGSNVLIGVPIVLQYDRTPLIDCLERVVSGAEMRFAIFGNDGAKLAVVKGNRVFPTNEGANAGVALRHPENMCVCELGGQTLFEVRKSGPSAWKLDAELYTPDGSFVQCHESVGGLINSLSGSALQIGNATFVGNVFTGSEIGFFVGSDGSMAVGTSRSAVEATLRNREIGAVMDPPQIEVKPLKMSPNWKRDIRDLIEGDN